MRRARSAAGACRVRPEEGVERRGVVTPLRLLRRGPARCGKGRLLVQLVAGCRVATRCAAVLTLTDKEVLRALEERQGLAGTVELAVVHPRSAREIVAAAAGDPRLDRRVAQQLEVPGAT